MKLAAKIKHACENRERKEAEERFAMRHENRETHASKKRQQRQQALREGQCNSRGEIRGRRTRVTTCADRKGKPSSEQQALGRRSRATAGREMVLAQNKADSDAARPQERRLRERSANQSTLRASRIAATGAGEEGRSDSRAREMEHRTEQGQFRCCLAARGGCERSGQPEHS